MGKTLVYYVSGHGYGHARRSAQVIRALLDLSPDVQVHIRTTATPRIFQNLLPRATVTSSELDAGAAEHSPLEIDPCRTLDRIADVLARRQAIVSHEVAFLKQVRPTLIASDIPFLAGDIAAKAGLPCVGVSNFTWDWIIEPYIDRRPEARRLVDAITESYSKMAAILRLPLGGISSLFPEVVDVPLVANGARLEKQQVLRLLKIDAKDDRPRVLFGIRGAIPTAILATAAKASPDLHFICPTNEPGDLPASVTPARIDVDLDFSDVLSVCDVVVGKMGYGLIAECIVSGVTLLWPRRTGFREDDVVERDGPRFLRMHEFPLEDFHAGRWRDALQAAVAMPMPPETMRVDGAAVCAEALLKRM